MLQVFVGGGASQRIQFSSVTQSCLTLCDPMDPACQASLSITSSRSPPKPMSIELVMPSNHFILCRPLLLLPSIFPSIRVFSNESALCIRWPKYWSVSFNISPSNEHSGLISFRMDWLDLLAAQIISFCLTSIEVLKGPAYSHWLRYTENERNLDGLLLPRRPVVRQRASTTRGAQGRNTKVKHRINMLALQGGCLRNWCLSCLTSCADGSQETLEV